MGSKSRIAKYIVPIIQEKIDSNSIHTYVEPFVGGANIIDKIAADKRIGCDKQKYLISLYQNLDKIKTLPENVSREHYASVRECFNKGLDTYEDWYIGAIGFLSSYNGRFFDGGYSGIVKTKTGKVRDYYNEAKQNLLLQAGKLHGIQWKIGDYKDTCSGYKDCVIYCDPPYYNAKQYASSKDFNYEKFWNWCRKMALNNIVLVSEQTAPKDFHCTWELPVERSIDNTKRVEATEKLFMYEVIS